MEIITERSSEALTVPEKRSRYGFIVYLRVICMFLVAYSHFGAMRHPEWFVTGVLRYAFNDPLGLMQDFGAFAVCSFFLISGFLAVQSSGKDRMTLGGACRYFLGKLNRVFLPLVITMVLSYLTLGLYSFLTGKPHWLSGYSGIDWLRSVLLLNHIQGMPEYINGALWYLAPLLGFDLLLAAAMWLGGRGTWFRRMLAFELLFALGLATSVSYLLPYAIMPLFGTVYGLKRKGRLSRKQFLFLMLLSWLLMITGFYRLQPHFYSGNSYPLSMAAAVLVFMLLELSEEKLPVPTRGWEFLSGISYEFYIVHGIVGALAMGLMESAGIPVSLAVPVSILLSLAWAWLSHRLVGLLKK